MWVLRDRAPHMNEQDPAQSVRRDPARLQYRQAKHDGVTTFILQFSIIFRFVTAISTTNLVILFTSNVPSCQLYRPLRM